MASINFKGKTAVWNHHLSVPYHTLEKDKKNSLEGKNNAENLIIEGDNLLALKALLPKYQGKVKCIYIDPPYNTGNESWVYSDKVSNPIIKNWIGEVVGKEGEDLVRHDKWLCMMTPRLRLLRELLSEEGVIFISIDENEVHNLRKICEEVFGVQNYAGELVWKNSSKNDQSYISMQHEYILCFVKDKSVNPGVWQEKKEGLDEIYKAFEGFKKKHGTNWQAIHDEAVKWYRQFSESNPILSSKHYSWMDQNGVYFPADISGPNFGQYVYDLKHPVTGKVCKAPGSGWRYPEKAMLERVKENLIHFGDDETTIPNNKTYLKDTEYQSLTSVKYRDGRVASKQLSSLIGVNIFTNPKDVDLLKTLFKAVGVNGSDIVLDSFAGSGSSAQAVLELNTEDKGNRRFVLVQLPEKIDEKQNAFAAGYKWVHEITRDRVKKVIERDKIDVGFTYYTLGPDIDGKKILIGKNMPTWDVMAKYVHFLATGNPVNEVTIAKKTWEITATKKGTGVYLIYADTLEELKKLAITRDWLEAVKDKVGKKIVYAPACFLDKEILDEYNISFVQVPFNLFTRK